jgi:sugar phosphate isomerase/epimerase
VQHESDVGESAVRELMLCNVSVGNVHLRQAIPAAVAAGFGVMSIAARPYAKSGMSPAELRLLLDDHGVRVQEIEASFDWLGLPDRGAVSWLHAEHTTGELIELGAELGAETVVGVHAGAACSVGVAAEAFGRFCDQAAAHGMKAALEYVAFATISDLETAWAVVVEAGRPNGGLLVDLWHHRRSLSADDLLLTIPPDRIYSVQLSDGGRTPTGTLLEDVQHRRLPGDGEFGATGFVRTLVGHGVTCPIGVEVFEPDRLRRDLPDALASLHRALAAVVRAGAGP